MMIEWYARDIGQTLGRGTSLVRNVFGHTVLPLSELESDLQVTGGCPHDDAVSEQYVQPLSVVSTTYDAVPGGRFNRTVL